MANSEQILSLIKSHVDGDDSRFRSLALQISASEAKAGHAVLARAIKDLLVTPSFPHVKAQFKTLNSDFAEVLLEIDPDYRISDLIINEKLKSQIARIIKEYIQRSKLVEYNLANRRKILMAGPSGTGKTMTASVIANELKLPLFVVRIEKVVTKFMGETSLKLSKVFDAIKRFPGVYLFDEFDAIGQQRGMDNEVGEMRRILNSFLQMMERDDSDSFILAATNDIASLDSALFRRFDDILQYSIPTDPQILQLLESNLSLLNFVGNMEELVNDFRGLSHADISTICKDAIKESLLDDVALTTTLVKESLSIRHDISKAG